MGIRIFKMSKWLFLISCLLPVFTAWGQSKADSLKQKHNESVTIYGSSRPVTGEALKINRKPQLPSLEMSTTSVISNFTDIKVPTSIQLKEIRPASHIPAAQQTPVWKNLLTLGLGSRISPLLDYFYSGGKPKGHRLTVRLLHHSSFLNIKDYLPSPYTYSKAGIGYDKYFPYHVLAIQGNYRISSNRYYGYNTKGDTLNYDKNDARLKQYYQVASIGIKFASNYRSAYRLNHLFRANGYYLSDKHGMSETNAHFDFDLYKGFRVSEIFNHQQLGIEGGFDYFKNKATGLSQNYQTQQDYFARLLPYFDARYGMFSFKAGLNFEWLQQTSGKLHFYPYLFVNVNVAPGIFSFFGGIDGGLKKNAYLNLSRENPYLGSLQNNFLWENTQLEAFGGFRGNIARHFGFEFRAGYRKFENMAFFDHPSFLFGPYLTSTSSYSPFKNKFHVFYVNGHVFNLNGSLTYAGIPNLNLWLKGEYNSYSLENDAKPLYKPLFSIQLGASYLINRKIKPWVEIYYMGQRWAAHYFPGFYNIPSPQYYLSGYFDINIGADYHIDKHLTGFIRVTNLLNKQYFRFDEYPVAGLEIMVGIRYRF